MDCRYAARRRSKRAAGSQRVEIGISDQLNPPETKKPRSQLRTGLYLRTSKSANNFQDLIQPFFSITKKHARILFVKQWVLDTGKA